MSRTFFTADQHFAHRNIIGYCNRPFSTEDGQPDLNAMHLALLSNWCNTVKDEDTVYVLGDFGFVERLKLFPQLVLQLSNLPGRKTLVRGNHDRSPTGWYRRVGFERVVKSLLLKTTYLVHCPPEEVPSGTTRVLCGHVHDKWRESKMRDCDIRITNVGVDVWNFRPVSAEELGVDL